MHAYTKLNNSLLEDEKDDIITGEEIPTDHPRKMMTIRLSNGVPFPYSTQTILDICSKGDGKDPQTRQPFDYVTRARASIYKRSTIFFPNYTLGVDNKDLFQRWLDSRISQDDRTHVEASAFLQIEDILFQQFNGKGSLENRDEAEKYLKNPDNTRKWLLRNSSLIDTQYNKGYVLSFLRNDELFHIPIVHKIGYGFCYNCRVTRNAVLSDNFSYESDYPTIISLLENNIPDLLN
jgi:hypothetical protein